MEEKKATSSSAKKPKVKITLNEKWCKNCGICIAFCPKGVFVADEFGKPIIKNPDQCIKCMLCVIRCPEFAMDVKDEEENKKEK